ncbi:MAG: hypothetical protein HY308_07520 [Gammaproteobacteria bacterium]|nr:hypothetical protein [Gammaproteobacteria bacterium]
MHRKTLTTLVSATLFVALPGTAAAGKFSWFDETPARDSLGQLRPPSTLFDRDKRLAFGVDAYKSLASDEEADGSSTYSDDYVVSFYGELTPSTNNYYSPLVALDRAAGETPLTDSSSNRLSGFGVKWQHRVDASNTFALTAGYSESPWTEQSSSHNLGILDTRAAVSWTSTGTSALRPGMTGSVFIGDESVSDDSYRRLDRRYFGVAVGGQLQVAQDHTPYVSYQLQRRFYNGVDDPAYMMLPYEDRSQVAAGWRWQVQPNWSLHAEASYGLNGASLDPYTLDRSRIFFGTRFDFR